MKVLLSDFGRSPDFHDSFVLLFISAYSCMECDLGVCIYFLRLVYTLDFTLLNLIDN